MSFKTTARSLGIYVCLMMVFAVSAGIDATYHGGDWRAVYLASVAVPLFIALIVAGFCKRSKFPLADAPPQPGKQDAEHIPFIQSLMHLAMFVVPLVTRFYDLCDPSVAIGWKATFVVAMALYAKVAIAEIQYMRERYKLAQRTIAAKNL